MPHPKFGMLEHSHLKRTYTSGLVAWFKFHKLSNAVELKIHSCKITRVETFKSGYILRDTLITIVVTTQGTFCSAVHLRIFDTSEHKRFESSRCMNEWIVWMCQNLAPDDFNLMWRIFQKEPLLSNARAKMANDHFTRSKLGSEITPSVITVVFHQVITHR